MKTLTKLVSLLLFMGLGILVVFGVISELLKTYYPNIVKIVAKSRFISFSNKYSHKGITIA